MKVYESEVRCPRFRWTACAVVFLHVYSAAINPAAAGAVSGPYALQVAEQTARLKSSSPSVRAGAAETLGFLRAYSSEPMLIDLLEDSSPRVRREAALALAWCGSRTAVEPLLAVLNDSDWMTAQGAWVALTNLTGMQFSFDALLPRNQRDAQAAVWRNWWQTVPSDTPPPELLEMLVPPANAALGCPVTASTTYKGPPDVLTDGTHGPAFWQTKNVDFPQACTVDLGIATEIDEVKVHQYGPRFVMTDCAIETSVDGKTYETIRHLTEATPVTLSVSFSPRSVRFVRVTSFATANPTYPTTFYELEALRAGTGERRSREEPEWLQERALRALGVLGGRGASDTVSETVARLARNRAATGPSLRPVVQAGTRALGRLRGDEAAFAALVDLLDNTELARFAADALGDFGDARAVPALLAAYPNFSRGVKGELPKQLPPDDRMRFPDEDRMFETPYSIAYALCRLPLDDRDKATLRQLTPLLLANLPGDHDAGMLYQREVGQMLTAYLLDQAGTRQQACEFAFEKLGQPRRVRVSSDIPELPVYESYRMSTWLSALCRDAKDLPRLIALLDHEDGWVRINAAKALAFLGDADAVPALAKRLAAARSEADYGYSGTFKDEEYNDPAPRYREAFVRALGRLDAREQVPLLTRILNDEESVLEVRLAAAQALDELGTKPAIAALDEAAKHHSFLNVRLVAREALWKRRLWRQNRNRHEKTPRPENADRSRITDTRCANAPSPSELEAVVFIKGDNVIPNTEGTVEQADRWYQTYVVTDSGPVYRPGRNIYVLRPPRPDGHVTPLTMFPNGYVADIEVSWDATRVLFCRRGQNDPWWHVYEIHADGSGLRQLTDGPYHDVGPNYLPDGRIVFASSRLGIRDEYHGYPCTSLHVMNADGSELHPIATNIGRDNEPVVLADGRIAFSRLEVFYSRLKTELTLHAVHPDGTQDVVLYGPERRQFWRRLDVGPRSPAHGQEAPLTHRVLRMTQPQPMPDGLQILCSTQGGLTLIGPQRNQETIIPHDKMQAFTTPFPLPDGRILCGSTNKAVEKKDVDVGLYLVDPATGKCTLVYNDPATADFEPRPLLVRNPPATIPVKPPSESFSGRFLCESVYETQESEVTRRGRLVRVIEGIPIVSRHSTQTNPWPVWKNHHGTLGRVLGTVPLASDGSFFLEIPADRLLHLQVLDSDRRVVGNQLTWIYARPDETKSCIGCHESPHTTTNRRTDLLALSRRPTPCLPDGDEFLYRAKAWFKGSLPAVIEERTRTVRAVNVLAR